ncbi:MAG: formate dehydrogenase [Theionarchaea archaeon DG-70-1]|nr:MAG: formate dehydrogenase [Theionarchaea archaeon DG-70-1]
MLTSVIVDGKTVQMEGGGNLLSELRNKGYDIPGLCYYEKVSSTGSCRLCVIKRKGSTTFEAACTLTAQQGMDIEVFTPELEEYRKEVLQLILSEHKHDCMVCEAAGECELEKLAYRYHIDISSEVYPHMYNKDLNPDVSQVLIFDPQKCIKCYRCTKACDELQEKHVLDMAYRSNDMMVWPGSTGVWSESECDGCGECIQACPVGAIIEKDAVGKGRTWEMAKTITTCEYCGVGCPIEVYTRDNEIVKVKGVDGPANDGRLCIKGRFGHEYIKSKERLTTPLIKKDGKFLEVSWDEALDYVAEKLLEIKQKYGSKALGGLSSARCTNEENYVFQKFVRAVFGNNNVDHCARLCHASTVAGLAKAFGSGAMTNSIAEFKNCDCILVTGSNTTETHPVIATFIKNAVRKGAVLIVADPRKIDLVNYAKVHLQHKNGTDVALFNGLMNIIYNEGLLNTEFVKERTEGFDEFIKVIKEYTPEKVEEITGVPKEKIIYAAKLYGRSKKASIVFAMGITQHTTGTDNVLSLANLAMLTGNVGRESTGVNPLRGQNNVQGACDIGALSNVYTGYQNVTDPEAQKKFEDKWGVTLSSEVGLTVVEMINKAAEGEIKALYFMGENPMISDPNITHVEEALSNLEFLVVQDIFLTETAQLADVVLPSRGALEKDGTFTNTERRIQRVKKVAEPHPNTKDDWEIIGFVAEKMGYNLLTYSSVWDILREINEVTPIYAGITPERVDLGLQWPCPSKDHSGTAYLHKGSFSRGKGSFTPVDFIQPAELPDKEYPFILSTGRILYHYHTGTMSRRTSALNAFVDEGYVEISREDAQKLNVKDNEIVKVSTRRGEIKIKAKISDRVFPGSVFIPFHFSEAPANRLTNDALDPKAKIPELKVAACKVAK